MSIVSSEAILDAHQQQGGGRYVIERHTDSTGRVHQVGPYLAPEGFDTQARLASRAVELLAKLEDDELRQVIAGLLNPNGLAHLSKAALALRIRALCAALAGIELCELATRVLATVENGQITDAEWRAAFGLTVNQWNNAKTQMGTMRTNLQACQNATGF